MITMMMMTMIILKYDDNGDDYDDDHDSEIWFQKQKFTLKEMNKVTLRMKYRMSVCLAVIFVFRLNSCTDLHSNFLHFIGSIP